MSTTLLAVFGHYDSRGGTTGIPLKERTISAVKEACTKYDEDCFYWSESNPEPSWVRPSQVDFLYIAEIHHDADELPYGELVGELTDVLIEREDDERQAGATENMTQEEFEAEIEATLTTPVSLELVRFPKPIDRDLDEDKQDAIKEYFANVLMDPMAKRWDDDAYSFVIGTGNDGLDPIAERFPNDRANPA